MTTGLNKSDIIDRMASRYHQLSEPAIEDAVKVMLEHMVETLTGGDRIEIRGFGSFALHHRVARAGRNPKTGQAVAVEAKSVPHFKPGKALRDAVNPNK
jgi:integration host factor subunit beta